MEHLVLLAGISNNENSQSFFLFPKQPYSDNTPYTFVQKDISKPQSLQVYLQKPHNLFEYSNPFTHLVFWKCKERLDEISCS